MRKYILSAALAVFMTAGLAAGASAYEDHGYYPGGYEHHDHRFHEGYHHDGHWAGQHWAGGYGYHPYYPSPVVVSGGYYLASPVAVPASLSIGLTIP